MAKTKKPTKNRDLPKLPAQKPVESTAPKSHAIRETVESIVIAFVLAFLFRTFEAEAFVIPTGSMAPTLMGRHKDVDCPKCGYRYQVSASEEAPDNPEIRASDCIAGMCPMCRYVMPMVPDAGLPLGVPERMGDDAPFQPSYNGDRILVNKYTYAFQDPDRWDVVVFKYPGDAKVNFIKRLVALPGETLRIYQGDLFIGDEKATQAGDFKIESKPADKVLAMRQLVHDTNYDPAELDAAGWPLRWQPAGDGDNGWKVEKSTDGSNVKQTYRVDASGGEAWLRYNHFVPNYEIWQQVLNDTSGPNEQALSQPAPRLIADANPYNGRIDRFNMPFGNSLDVSTIKQGIHWVGDLSLEADVQVESNAGDLNLELIEGGRAFRCTIDLANGQAKLSAPGAANFAPKAKTPIAGPGSYHVCFANVDDQLLLWVDGELVSFDAPTTYDADQVFGERSSIRPQTSAQDPGDLAPARVGARGAKLVVSRLQVWRDIYYIADKYERNNLRTSNLIVDFPMADAESLEVLLTDPSSWEMFDQRRHVDFKLGKGQLFVMGDNSAESSDARLWTGSIDREGQIRGQYLERRLLIGKALCVYWPHSWNRIPGTPIPFPLFPNFEDMRLVR